MEALLDYAPQMAAVLAGGLIASLGPVALGRTGWGRGRLARLRGWALAIYALVGVGTGAWAFTWMYRALVESVGGGAAAVSPTTLFFFGLAIGLPLSAPGLAVAWHQARAADAQGKRRRDFVPTRDDRRDFAEKLQKQIEEIAAGEREVRVRVGGDGDRVLLVEGDFGAEEGERLTAALRGEMKELGFKRVEGSGPGGEWWSRV